MDLLSQHEAFLRAIFDAPDDDTPRLVYADFLQENGEEDRAEFIRLSCAEEQYPTDDPRRIDFQADINAIVRKHTQNPVQFGWPWERSSNLRGFPLPIWVAEVKGFALRNSIELRENAVRRTPEWYGTRMVRVTRPPRVDADMFDVLFAVPVFARMIELDFSGKEEPDLSGRGSNYSTSTIEPVITSEAVVALAQHRGIRRITTLDLRYNDLGNDAARALVKSPYLDNLKRLQLLDGNRFRGKVWQQVIERFGEDVVG